ncbi:MAG: hypothetical protein A2675_00600 [Candidatus Yonathbacteria bacterium RIFCSPHIGHO2_01_FULL_51_10]|uniref:Sec-independent protein translocase protein TatA n=1 Tax=Candidatus Yonathbacteria bacterium RIFCSPHIGHO2_01_FULL_51_10 TaxID=1802723 RepID=A0A1G2S5H6_9BACT|nr:MAG: hypothetical protein A2675_00600 [Candidatus Yonathbacteria bacterium RIFCSPHIGHO2_01_FULL_51_10]
MFGLGINEVVIIGIVFLVLFYGAGKMTDIAKSVGRLTGEYKKGKMEVEKEIEKAKKDLK